MAARRRVNRSTESVDNYLKAILSLGGAEECRVTIKALADRLSVAPASVTNMLQKLALSPAPLVEYERHRGVRLSSAGKRRALEVVRHHRLIETFLYQVLDYPLEELHEEAERLEHFISERFEQRIAAKLGDPRTDPHGHSIPTMEGKMPRGERLVRESIVLADVVEEDGTYVVDSVADRDAHNLRLIEACGITPGARLRVRKIASSGGLFGEDRPLLQGRRTLPRGRAGCADRPPDEIAVTLGPYDAKERLPAVLRREQKQRTGVQKIAASRLSAGRIL